MKQNNKIPLIYLWIYKKMVDRFGKQNQIIVVTQLVEIMRRTVYQVPNKYNYFIMKEMIDYGLIEKVNQQKYKLLASEADSKLRVLDNYFFW